MSTKLSTCKKNNCKEMCFGFSSFKQISEKKGRKKIPNREEENQERIFRKKTIEKQIKKISRQIVQHDIKKGKIQNKLSCL